MGGIPEDCLEDAVLAAYSRGELGESAADVAAHLAACPRCSFELLKGTGTAQPGADVTGAVTDAPGLPEDPLLPPGTQVGRYLLQEKAGAGGMGVVYAAVDPTLNRRVALKLVRAASGVEGETAGKARLLREGQALAQLSHPNVVSVFEMGTFGDRVFIAMEFVEGQTLRDWLMPTRSWRESVPKLLAAGAGLAAAHAAGIVHRDFKLENVLLGKSGRVFVMDFGIARAADAEELPARRPLSVSERDLLDTSTPLTQAGAVVGTVGYMAPELFQGAPADARSDQFSFCVALYRALYQQAPFAPLPLKHPLRWVMTEPPKGAKVPRWLRRIVERGLRPAPEQRYPSMEALLAELAVDPAVRRWRVGLAVAAGLLALSGAAFYRQATLPRCKDGAARLAGVWDGPVQGALRSAFLATGHPNAGTFWTHAHAGLSAYAASWVQMRDDACAATRLRGEQSDEVLSLRMACLDRRMGELEAVVDVLRSLDAASLSQGVKAARGLPSVASCGDVQALRAPVRPPDDPQVRAEVLRLEKEAARVTALFLASKYQDGLKRAQVSVEAAQKLRYRPLEAEVLRSLAALQSRSGALKDARRTFLRALWAAEAGGDVGLCARISAEAGANEVQLGAFDGARDWISQGEAFLEHLGGNPFIEATLAAAAGHLGLNSNNMEQALAAYQRARLLVEKAYGRDHVLVATSLDNVSLALASLGKMAEGVALGEKALQLRVRLLGPEHADTLMSTHNVGIFYQRMAQYEKSSAYFRQAVAGREVTLGPKHLHLATSLEALAENELVQGRYDSARALLDRAMAIVFEIDRGHALYGGFQVVQAHLLRLRGNPNEALALLERTAAVTNMGADPSLVSLAESERALALDALGRPAEALTCLERCLQQKFGPGEEEAAALCHETFGRWHLGRQSAAKAVESFQHANELREKAFGPESALLARSLIGLGTAQSAQRQWASARAALERGLGLAEREKLAPELLGAGHFALAQVLLASGDGQQARALAARAVEELSAPGARAERARAQAWLAVNPVR